MYAGHLGRHLGPGVRVDFVDLPPNGEPFVGYTHQDVARIMAARGLPSAGLRNGTNMNLYAYVGNNPVRRVDPSGNAWWEFIPFVSTALHTFAHVPGEKWSDYKISCRVTRRKCNAGALLAELACDRCLFDQAWGFVGEWLGVPIGYDFVRGGLTAAIAKAMSQHAVKYGGRAVIGGALTAGILTGDAAADIIIVATRATNIVGGYNEAVKRHCSCTKVAGICPRDEAIV